MSCRKYLHETGFMIEHFNSSEVTVKIPSFFASVAAQKADSCYFARTSSLVR